MKPTIIVTGSNGQLGNELRDLAGLYTGYHFVFLSREQFAIENVSETEKIFEKYRPASFINCAAYTAVDRAESEMEMANSINGTAVGVMAKFCKQHQCHFLHFSTDYVFNGNASVPLTEKDEVDPVNSYGASKLLGEREAIANNDDCIIIRTSWVYSSYGKNFVKTMMRLMEEKTSISVVNDQKGSPTYAADLAEAVMIIVDSGNWVPGIYHFSNEGEITWYEFAKEIKRLGRFSCDVVPITTDRFPTPAKRPAYSVLDKRKITGAYGIRLKNWKASLENCMSKLKSIS